MSSFQRTVLIALGLFFAVASGLGAAPKWLKAQSGDVTVLSDLSRRDITDIAVRFTAYRHAVATLLASPGQMLPPSILIVFRNSSKLEELLANGRSDDDHKIISRTAIVDGTTEMAATSDDSRGNTLSFVFEFDAMNTIDRLGYFLPVWMSQGTGEVFASMIIKKDHLIIGTDNERVSPIWQREPEIAWKRFFEISQSSPEYAGKDARGEYQAQAWALMHTILLDRGSPHDRFVETARLVRENPRGGIAAEAVLGISLDKFATIVGYHMRTNRTVNVPFDSVAAAAQVQVTDAPEAEVRVRTADILAGAGKDSLVDAELARANELAPNTAIVDEAIARSRAENHDGDGEVEHYRKAIKEGSRDEEAYLVSARAHLDESLSGNYDHEGDGGTNVPPAIDEIHQALKLDSTNRAAWQLLARAYFLKNHLDESDPDDLLPALTNDDEGLELRLRRAAMYQRLGHRDLVFAELKRITDNPGCTDELRMRSRNYHDAIQFESDEAQVRQLTNERKFKEALAVLHAGRDGATTVGFIASYDKVTALMTEAQAAADLFALFKAKQYADFVVKIDGFAAAYPRDNNLSTLRSMQERAQALLPSETLPSEGATGTAPAGPTGSINPGAFADDERFGPFSSYLDDMYARIKRRWQSRIRTLPLTQFSGTVISIRVTLNSKGEVISMLRLDDERSDAASPCFAAIRDMAPFGKWTPEMTAALGAQQTVVVRFVY